MATTKRNGPCHRISVVYSDEPIVLDGTNSTRIDYDKCCNGFVNYGCGICIKECPFSNINYEKIEQSFHKMNQKEKEKVQNGN
ncbi:MAG: hypothetical protein CVU95_15070 [Firmicutes bacterium HGW-Firmicutes-2]|jgi:ferredoxin|nr:MAG: hypothetical protein CVU95_15070 [Firmicutes bacterium HGW-Firmicutes-2]